jgi:steroid delta-isomerase-like uncharacterized protein
VDTAALIRTLLDAWNAGDHDGIAKAYSADMLWSSPWTIEPLKGREAFMKIEDQMLVAFSDIHWEAPSIIAGEKSAAYEFLATSRHTGPLQLDGKDVPPQGKTVTMKGSAFVWFNDDGEIYEERRYFDPSSMRRQLLES